MIEYRDTTRADAEVLARFLRPEDAEEVRISSGLSPLGAILSSLMVSESAVTAHVDGTPAAIFGCTTHSEDPEIGIPWFLGTPLVAENKVAMLRDGREYISFLTGLYHTLINAVHWRNEASIKWVEALGFQRVDTLHNYGVERDTFYLYAFYV